MNSNTVSKLLLCCVFALGSLAFAPPSAAHSANQTDVRVIELEYARQNNGRSIPDDQLEYYLDRAAAGWTMGHIRQDMETSRRTSPDNPWRPQTGWSATSVVCSSVDNRYRECAVPLRGTAVLSQQISESACVDGRGWGQKQGMVWVNHGCRARFTMVPDVVANRPTVVCKSKKGERNVCNTGMTGQVELVNRFKGSSPCIQGRTWGQRANQVWVSDNCRARFAPASRQYPGESGRPGGDNNRDDRDDRDDRRGGDGWRRDANYSVTCASDSRLERCNWDGRYGSPRLAQRLSQAACVEGRSWGYSQRDGLWVNGGCRARFTAP